MTWFKVCLSIVAFGSPVPLNSRRQGCFPTTGLIISLGQLFHTTPVAGDGTLRSIMAGYTTT